MTVSAEDKKMPGHLGLQGGGAGHDSKRGAFSEEKTQKKNCWIVAGGRHQKSMTFFANLVLRITLSSDSAQGVGWKHGVNMPKKTGAGPVWTGHGGPQGWW